MKSCAITLAVVLVVLQTTRVQAIDEDRQKMDDKAILKSFTECVKKNDVKNDAKKVEEFVTDAFCRYKDIMVRKKQPNEASPSNDEATDPAGPSADATSPTDSDDEGSSLEATVIKLFVDGVHKLCDDIKKDTATCSATIRNSIPLYVRFSELYLDFTDETGKDKLTKHCGPIPTQPPKPTG